MLCAMTYGGQAQAQANPSQRGALASGPVSNFARDRNIAVRQRPRPDYEAKGLPLGGFDAYPKISATAEYNSNIYALRTNEIEDVIWRVQPEIAVVSNWNRHGLRAYARATANRYQDNSSENTTDYGFGAAGQLDVLRFSNITAGADFARMTEPRTETQQLTGGGPFTGSLEPVRFDQASAYLAGQHELNRLRLSSRLDYRKLDYEDVPRATPLTPVDQDYRDRTITSVLGRADYAVTPDTAFFIQASANKRDYDFVPAGFVRRDSEGSQILAGANFELGAVVRGELAAGYMVQEYDDARVGQIDGVGARAEVEWFPSELTTITLTGARTIEDAAVPASPGFVSSNVGAEIAHELMRNVVLAAQVSYGDDEYEGIVRKDKRLNGFVSATYLLNRNVGLTGSYGYSDLKSSGANAGPEFKVHRVSATLTLQF
jgi:hypothetical protein